MSGVARHTQSGQRSLGYEVSGVALVAVAIFLGLALLSYQPGRPQTNLVGVIGYLLADLLCSALGKMSYALPALAVYTAGLQFRLWRCTAVTSQAVSLGVFGLASTALLSLWYADRPAVYAGGWIGGWLAVSLRTGLNQLGAYLVLIPVLVASLMGISRLSLHALGGRLLIGGRFVGDWCGVGLRPLAAGLRSLAHAVVRAAPPPVNQIQPPAGPGRGSRGIRGPRTPFCGFRSTIRDAPARPAGQKGGVQTVPQARQRTDPARRRPSAAADYRQPAATSGGARSRPLAPAAEPGCGA